MEIDLKADTTVGGAWVQGLAMTTEGYFSSQAPVAYWTTSVRVYYRTSQGLEGEIGGGFTTNNDRSTANQIIFPTDFTARYFKFKPTAWNNYPCLRVALLATRALSFVPVTSAFSV